MTPVYHGDLRAYLYVWKGAFAVAHSERAAKNAIRKRVQNASRGAKVALEMVLAAEPLVFDEPVGFLAEVQI